MASSNRFIVYGAHITENLLHHKTTDVRRILEDKGFKEGPSDEIADATQFFPASGEPEGGKQTIISFGAGGFVEDDGVRHLR